MVDIVDIPIVKVGGSIEVRLQPKLVVTVLPNRGWLYPTVIPLLGDMSNCWSLTTLNRGSILTFSSWVIECAVLKVNVFDGWGKSNDSLVFLLLPSPIPSLYRVFIFVSYPNFDFIMQPTMVGCELQYRLLKCEKFLAGEGL